MWGGGRIGEKVMKKTKLFLCLAAVLFFVYVNGHAQILNTSRLGLGFNIGGQKIFCEHPHTGFGFGAELYAKYKISPRLFATGALGYGELSDGTSFYDESNFTTDLISLDIKGGMNLVTEGTYIPYVYVGLGVFNFKYSGFTERYSDGSIFFGGGLEARLNPVVALDFGVDYRYTTGDDLNGINYSAKDGYLNIKSGITYYLSPQFAGGGSGDPEFQVTERAPIEEIEGVTQESPDQELNALIEGLDSYEEASDANMAMEEYIKLKSRVDQLNDAIRQKELEIEELKAQLSLRKEKVAELETNLKRRGGALAASLNVDLNDFATSYEQALQHFYSREYDAAIYLFSMLLETSSTHKLASNCQYWLGECYFGQGDLANAVDAFQRVLPYENSYKKDDALLMLGRTYIKLGDRASAKQMFDELIYNYPDSEYIERAQKYANGL